MDQLRASLEPFEALDWPKYSCVPTPFRQEERDQILAWYAQKLWRVAGFASPQPWLYYYSPRYPPRQYTR